MDDEVQADDVPVPADDAVVLQDLQDDEEVLQVPVSAVVVASRKVETIYRLR